MEGKVYMIINTKNNKKYIGSTVDFKLRKKSHLNGLRGQYHDNRKLQQEFNEYGESVFAFRILCGTHSKEERFKIEEDIIKNLRTYVNGYNLSIDGRGRYIITQETRNKMKINTLGERNPFYGRLHTKETKATMSRKALINNKGKNNPFYGRTHTKETLEKIARSHEKLKASGWESPLKGVPKTEKATYNNMMAQPNRKPVHAEGEEYPSVSACAKSLGIVNGTVRNRISNKNFPDYYFIND